MDREYVKEREVAEPVDCLVETVGIIESPAAREDVSEAEDRPLANDCRPNFLRRGIPPAIPLSKPALLDRRRVVSLSLLLPLRLPRCESDSLPDCDPRSKELERRRCSDRACAPDAPRPCCSISATNLDAGNSTKGDMGAIRSAGILESCLPVRIDFDGFKMRDSTGRRPLGLDKPLNLRADGLLEELLSLVEDSVSALPWVGGRFMALSDLHRGDVEALLCWPVVGRERLVVRRAVVVVDVLGAVVKVSELGRLRRS